MVGVPDIVVGASEILVGVPEILVGAAEIVVGAAEKVVGAAEIVVGAAEITPGKCIKDVVSQVITTQRYRETELHREFCLQRCILCETPILCYSVFKKLPLEIVTLLINCFRAPSASCLPHRAGILNTPFLVLWGGEGWCKLGGGERREKRLETGIDAIA
ncbi:MAG: hypothetical protein ABL876_15405 [Chitinophagaceae bacterium]